jgi:hypothetical protein
MSPAANSSCEFSFSKEKIHNMVYNKISRASRVRDGNFCEDKRVVDSLAQQMSQLRLQQQKASGVWPQVRKFCGDSSLHAIKYVTDLNSHVTER